MFGTELLITDHLAGSEVNFWIYTAEWTAMFIVAGLFLWGIFRVIQWLLTGRESELKQAFRPRSIISTILIWMIIGLSALIVNQTNFLNIRGWFMKQQQSWAQKKSEKAAKQADKDGMSKQVRLKIKKMVMRNAQPGFKKQGFVSIPSVNILEPIYNDAYSAKGLSIGAAVANRSEEDPSGTKMPVMGKGNYGLAAHNFNDGKSGFSPLQEVLNQAKPYLIWHADKTATLAGSDWLNDKHVYLAGPNGVFDYKIVSQKTVSKTQVSVLNQSKDGKLTIISCLFPDTAYRIITTAKLDEKYTWTNAPASVVQNFDLRQHNTNTYAGWYVGGVEEGANGDAGGTK